MLRSILVGNMLHENTKSPLGTGISRAVFLTAPSMRGACEYNGTATIQTHVLNSLLAAKEATFEVNSHYPIECIFVTSIERRNGRYTRIHIKPVYFAKLFIGLVKQYFAILNLTKVGIDKKAIAAIGLHQTNAAQCGFFIQITDNHFRSLTREFFCSSTSNPPGTTSDNDYLIL